MTLTPPELARRWRCKPDAVRLLLERGLLAGFNVADPDATRPRWRISLDAVLAFEAGRRPEPEQPRRRKQSKTPVPTGPF
ncbi:MAG: hypothetical protein KF861_07090 [Planctomycetaceae bacterium]|nr:hypothetical protein [Planctomycetaceae bacterium]